jgi:hypothetical protein
VGYLVVWSGNSHDIRSGVALLDRSRRHALRHRMCDSSVHIRYCKLDSEPVDLHARRCYIGGHCMAGEDNHGLLVTGGKVSSG